MFGTALGLARAVQWQRLWVTDQMAATLPPLGS